VYKMGKLGSNALITPNTFEFKIFYKRRLGDDIVPRMAASMEVAKRLGTNVLLKGHETVVTDGKRCKIIRARSSALATMGTGDVLAGMISGFAVNGNDLFVAAVAGAYANSLIGDILYKNKGNHIIATDVVEAIPKVLKDVA